MRIPIIGTLICLLVILGISLAFMIFMAETALPFLFSLKIPLPGFYDIPIICLATAWVLLVVFKMLEEH